MQLGLPVSTLLAFVLVLARVGGFVAFLPLPGFRNAPESIRAALALMLTLALFPVWPSVPNALPSIAELTAWGFTEAGFGLAVGLSVTFLTEAFQLGAQIVGLQAGYGYATSIDPTSQADSGVLQILTMLMTGLLMFSAGIDRELLRLLGASFIRFPAGSWAPSAASLDGLVRLGSGMFALGLRMAMPVIALLLLIDLSLALIGRMQQQLQLLSLAFPLKMLATLALLAVLTPLLARLFTTSAQGTLDTLWRSLGA
jgi:flagellar biosynthesis protein FliR